MKVISADTKIKMGWRFKISSNDYDGGVLIVAHHLVFQSVHVKSFLNEDDARIWVEMLIAQTRMLIEESVQNAKPRTT